MASIRVKSMPPPSGSLRLRRSVRCGSSRLRRNLLDPRRTMLLNRSDPLGGGADFTRIDAMAETLWGAVQRPNGAVSAESAAIAA